MLPGPQDHRMSVNELLLACLKHAEVYYCKDEEPTEQFKHVKRCMTVDKATFRMTAAADFGPLRLKTVREKFIAAGQCRAFVNANIQRVKRIFKMGH